MDPYIEIIGPTQKLVLVVESRNRDLLRIMWAFQGLVGSILASVAL